MHIPDRATSTRSRTPILFYLVAKTVVELKWSVIHFWLITSDPSLSVRLVI
jgi:hypothetical protein